MFQDIETFYKHACPPADPDATTSTKYEAESHHVTEVPIFHPQEFTIPEPSSWLLH